MPHRYRVAILYRPFTITDPTILNTVATDTSIRHAYDALRTAGFEVEVVRVGEDIRSVLQSFDRRETVIFNYCDGFIDDPTGYDPITQLFEALGFVYTGAHDRTLDWSRDKTLIKQRLVESDIPTPAYAVSSYDVPPKWTHFPAIAKPALQHGSYGISRFSVVDTPDQLEEQIRQIGETWKQPTLIEEFIDGMEFRVSLWGNGHIEVLPLMGIRYAAEDHRERLKTFDTKWADDELTTPMRIEVPTDISPALREQIEDITRRAYRAVEMRDYGGIDVRVRGDQAYVIDPNANPDMSEVSNFLRCARAAGLDYPQMLTKIVQLAAERLPAE